jgi:hypothetical protein
MSGLKIHYNIFYYFFWFSNIIFLLKNRSYFIAPKNIIFLSYFFPFFSIFFHTNIFLFTGVAVRTLFGRF